MYIEECDGRETEEEVFSDDDAEEDPTPAKKTRGKSRRYDLPIVSFASVELAEKAMRKKLFGGHWKQHCCSTGIGLLESNLSGLAPGAQKQARCKETNKASPSSTIDRA